MKALIVYDSRYGNTEKIACSLRDGLAGAPEEADVELIRASDAPGAAVAGRDLVLVGGPTHGTNPSPGTHEFLKRIPENALSGVKVAAFDTRTDPEQLKGMARVFARILDQFGYAAPKISVALKKRGGQVIREPEGFIVLDMEGPLQEGELERAREWAQAIAARRVAVCRGFRCTGRPDRQGPA